MTSSSTTNGGYLVLPSRNERPRARAVRRFAAFGGAVFLAPYLVIKVSWVLGAAVGWLPIGRGFSLAGWLGLNTVTVLMAATGIALSLALADTARVRAPAVAILTFAWIATGFLVPMLPYLVLSSALSSDDAPAPAQTGSAGSELPGWEAALIQVSFGGLGLALAVALPLYLLKHWPDAFTGRLGDRTGSLRPTAAVAISAAVLVGAVRCFWEAGGQFGLARPQARDLDWYLQTGNSACWTLLGAGCVWMLVRRRPARVPLWVPMTITWVVSGFLVAWNVWRLPFILFVAVDGFPDGVVWPEQLLVQAVISLFSILAGATMLVTALRTYRTAISLASDIVRGKIRRAGDERGREVRPGQQSTGTSTEPPSHEAAGREDPY
jgi:hypothetical protein